MCEPQRTSSPAPHAALIDAARALLAQADETADPALKPWTELPTLYEVTALLARRFAAIGNVEERPATPSEAFARSGAHGAARHLLEACQALENAWIRAYPPGTRTMSLLPETSVNP